MTYKAKAKLNISLDVVGKREDGYHDLRMIMHSVDLCDDITLTPNDSGVITVSTNLSYIPCDNRNLAYRAAEKFFGYTKIKNPGLHIDIFKRIPVCAGIGGGSSDAACVLRGLNEITGANLPLTELATLGKSIGADVPYCVLGGTMLAEGIGETLTALPPLPKAFIVIAKPKCNLSTQQVFSEVSVKDIKLHPDTSGIVKALEAGDLNGVCKRMYNVLEEPAKAVLSRSTNPDVIDSIRNIMMDFGSFGALMSGSGPTVFGIFVNEENAKSATEKLENICEFVYITTT